MANRRPVDLICDGSSVKPGVRDGLEIVIDHGDGDDLRVRFVDEGLSGWGRLFSVFEHTQGYAQKAALSCAI